MPFERPDWYLALTISERISNNNLPRPLPSSSAHLDKAAVRRLREWQEQPPCDLPEWFSHRLSLDGLTEEQFSALLAESPESLKQRCTTPPRWLTELKEAFSGRLDSAEETQAQLQLQETPTFLPLITPLIQQATDRVRRIVEDLSRSHRTVPFDLETVIDLVLPQLASRLNHILSRTAVLELNVSRLSGLLQGDTPEERFKHFIDHHRQQNVTLDFLREYPVLARLAVNCAHFWAEASGEFLTRLTVDWPNLVDSFFGGTSPGTLVEVRGGLGDSHRRGRSVLIARFSSGSQIVYKPKALSVDSDFGVLLDWLNQRGAPDLQAPSVLDRGSYGWSEFVAASPCEDRGQVALFYRRLGALLALLYVLEANDFHRENLIAAGAHPMLVDLESLFHPRLPNKSGGNSEAGSVLGDSVLRVGLLPQPNWTEGGEILDLSGLAGQGGQLSVQPVPYWENIGRDDMRLVRKRLPFKSQPNRPTLDGEAIDPLEFSEDFVEGFTSMYKTIEKNREDILSCEGPLASFLGDEVRVICRATQFYAALLNETFHPDCLRNALDRERAIDRLWFGVSEESLHYAGVIIPHEREDLWAGDIPFFYTHVGSCDLWTSTGKKLPAFFERSGMEAVSSRLKKLGKEDLERQRGFIYGSLTALALTSESQWSGYVLTSTPKPVDDERLIGAACEVGDRISALALSDQGAASWVGLVLVGSHRWILRPLGTDLYAGLPGIVLFLAYLNKVTGEEKYRALAELALTSLRKQLKLHSSKISLIGGFEGWGGLIYLWAHLIALWQEDGLNAEVEEMMQMIAPRIHEDCSPDIMSGSAGGLAALLTLHHSTGAPLALELADQMGKHIVRSATPCDVGVGWRVGVSPERPLTGFSHGSAGIAWALLRLFGHTGDESLRQTALRALEFERSTYVPEVGNWLDLRSGRQGDPQYMTSWCHGAPGIGISRLQMLRYLDCPSLLEDLRVAISTTLRSGFGGNHSLCHGDFGNLELILEASLLSGYAELSRDVTRLASQILGSIEEHGWRCGVPLGAETPGLMHGLAGIGYGLLRVAAPEQVPSVLVLEPPRIANEQHLDRLSAEVVGNQSGG